MRNPTTSSVCEACAGDAARRVREPATAAFSAAESTYAEMEDTDPQPGTCVGGGEDRISTSSEETQ